jgi:hypothetical protein
MLFVVVAIAILSVAKNHLLIFIEIHKKIENNILFEGCC